MFIVTMLSGACFAQSTTFTLQQSDGPLVQNKSVVLLRRGTDTVYMQGSTNNSGVVTFNIPAGAPALDLRLNANLGGFVHPTRLWVNPGANMYFTFPPTKYARVKRLGVAQADYAIYCFMRLNPSDSFTRSSMFFTDSVQKRAGFCVPLGAKQVVYQAPDIGLQTDVIDVDDAYDIPATVDMIELVEGLPALNTPTGSNGVMTFSWNTISGGVGVMGYDLYIRDISENLLFANSMGNVTSATLSGFTPGAGYFFAVAAYDNSGQYMAVNFSNSFIARSSTPAPMSTDELSSAVESQSSVDQAAKSDEEVAVEAAKPVTLEVGGSSVDSGLLMKLNKAKEALSGVRTLSLPGPSKVEKSVF